MEYMQNLITAIKKDVEEHLKESDISQKEKIET
jgi:hypothetical protein